MTREPQMSLSGFSSGLTRLFATSSVSLLAVLGSLVDATAQQKIITDPNAAIQFRPNVGTSGNGTPQIDIAAPSSGGLSHNKFKTYDIDARGVILNNSQTPGLSI